MLSAERLLTTTETKVRKAPRAINQLDVVIHSMAATQGGQKFVPFSVMVMPEPHRLSRAMCVTLLFRRASMSANGTRP